MKILYDHQCFIEQEYGGVSRWFFELMQYYSQDSTIDFELPLLYSTNHYLDNQNFWERKDIPKFPQTWLWDGSFPGKGKMYNLAVKLGLVNTIYKIKSKNIEYTKDKIINDSYDIFHPSYYDDYFLQNIEKVKKPFIVTVHDMIHELFPGYYSVEDIVYKNKKLLCEKATRVIVNSNNTKRDLCSIYEIDPNKVDVIYLGNSIDPNIEKKHSIHNYIKNYILYVGHRWNYKNFIRLLVSIAPILRNQKDLFFVCAGGGRINLKEIRLAKELGIEHKIIYIPLKDDATLSGLYKRALLFVYSSLYEGFGIPLLEAMACGCPVVCSDTSSFPEVSGDAVMYFNPVSIENMTESINLVLENPEKRKFLIQSGLEQVKKYSWVKTAEETKKVYLRALEN